MANPARKRVLITGAGGFVGPHLIRHLQERGGQEIYASVYSATSDLAALLPADQIISGDLTNFDEAQKLIKKTNPDVIYHLAAISIVYSSFEKAGEVLTTNTRLQYNLLEATKMFAPNARFISICSAHAYGLVKQEEVPIKENTPLRPLNTYAVSKISQEMLSLQYYYAHNLDVVILRPFNHTGEGQTADFVIPALAKQFAEIASGKKEPVIEVGNTTSIRDFTDVKDMVRAYTRAADLALSGEVYNIGFGKGSSIGEIIHLFEEIAGVKVEIKVKESHVRASDVPILICDASKFQSLTGWSPTIKLKETLGRVYNYMKEQG